MAFVSSALRGLLLVSFGLVSGYLVVTLTESFMHDHVHHAGKRFRELQQRYPSLLNAFRQAFRAHHIVHHFGTYIKDHVTQFKDSEHKRKVDATLTDKHGRRIISEAYGRTINLRSAILFLVPLVPVLVPILVLTKLAFSIGFLVPVVIYPLMSKLIHPYLHMRYDEAILRAPLWLRWCLKTRYMRIVWRHHWIHHRNEQKNFNLILGGDYLRGVHQSPSQADLAEMRKIGIPTD